jgi:hypothetical protein
MIQNFNEYVNADLNEALEYDIQSGDSYYDNISEMFEDNVARCMKLIDCTGKDMNKLTEQDRTTSKWTGIGMLLCILKNLYKESGYFSTDRFYKDMKRVSSAFDEIRADEEWIKSWKSEEEIISHLNKAQTAFNNVINAARHYWHVSNR